MTLPDPRRRSLRISPIFARLLCAGLLCAGPLQTGCLVPIPLEQQGNTDGGQLLVVVNGSPGFGTQHVIDSFAQFHYSVDVLTDSTQLAGRLYLQLNGSCCDLNVTDRNSTRFLQDAEMPQPIEAGSQRYTINFNQAVQPCVQVSSGSVAFIVPVVASGGFVDRTNRFEPEGFGQVDSSHYWTVFCP